MCIVFSQILFYLNELSRWIDRIKIIKYRVLYIALLTIVVEHNTRQ